MRCFIKAAVLLLPPIVSALILRETVPGLPNSIAAHPYDVVVPDVDNGRGIEYRPQDGIVEFSLPCQNCSVQEREAVERQSFVLNISQIPQGCDPSASEDGITINGQSLRRSSTDANFASGFLQLEEKASWTTGCGCIKIRPDNTCDLGDIVQVLFLELSGIVRAAPPSFAVYLRRVYKPQIIRLSLFADKESVSKLLPFLTKRSSLVPSSPLSTKPEPTFYHSTVLDEAISSLSVAVPVYPSSTITTSVVIGDATSTPSRGNSRQTSSPSSNTPMSSNTPSQSLTVQGGDVRGILGTFLDDLRTKAKNLVDGAAERLKNCHDLHFSGHSQKVDFNHGKVAEEQSQPSASLTASPSSRFQSISVPTKTTSLFNAMPDPTTGGSIATPPAFSSSTAATPAFSDPSPILISVTLSNPATQSARATLLSPDSTRTKPTPVLAMPLELPTPPSPPSEQNHLAMFRTPQSVLALKLTAFIFVIVCLIIATIVHCCANPRRMADWAACREECRNRRLYRKAARRQKLRNWFQRFRRSRLPPQTNSLIAETWEEKRELALDAQFPERASMREEIYAMRTAHRVVDRIVSAEEGRAPNPSFLEKYRKTRVGRRGNSFSSNRSLVSGPPAYEESEGEVQVVDGFGYVPRGPICTPDSSVIDTSPRTSLYLRDSDSEKD